MTCSQQALRPATSVIFDLHEAESASRCGRAGERALARRKDSSHLLWSEIPAADFNQRANDVPHHVAEEAAPLDAINNQLKPLLHRHSRLEDLPNGAAPFCRLIFIHIASSRKRGKIMRAFEEPCRPIHPPNVERVRIMMSISRNERRAHRLLADAIAIGFAASGIAGMKVRRHFVHSANAHRKGQRVVQGLLQVAARNTAGCQKIGHLSGGMRAGVGATRTVKNNLFIQDHFQALLEQPLNGGPIGLPLPAKEVGAVIGYQQSKVALSLPHALRTYTEPKNLDNPKSTLGLRAL